MTSRSRAGFLLLPILLAPVACGVNPFGAPVRVSTHGYRALVTLKEGESARSFEVSRRGRDWRIDPDPAGGPGPYTLYRGGEKRAWTIDPSAKTVTEAPFRELAEIVPGHPLAPGFDEREEAKQRGVSQYAREGDEIFSGRACWLWRFPDKERDPDPADPTTTFWVAPDLERLVVRVDHDVTKPDGSVDQRSSTRLTSIRVGAPESLFRQPDGFRRVEGVPARPDR